jgi:hypothetical protein
MASGIKSSCNRPKVARNLRTKSEKKFRNDNAEARGKYSAKMAARAARKLKKAGRRKK